MGLGGEFAKPGAGLLRGRNSLEAGFELVFELRMLGSKAPDGGFGSGGRRGGLFLAEELRAAVREKQRGRGEEKERGAADVARLVRNR